ncbi:MAG: glycosyltransferase family 2 protein [Candidatus Tectimicrobiota bacterium]
MKLSVIVPVYNERPFIEEILRRVEAVPIDKEIVVVDDGSTDGTREVLAKLEAEGGITVVYHPTNRGKGAAIRTALAHITGELVIIQDADLEYDPDDYPDLLAPFTKDACDVVYGTRLVRGKAQRVHLFWHYLGNKFLTLVTNVLFNATLSDMETGYKVFRADLLKSLELRANRFDIEPELTAKVLKRHCRVFEVPIAYYGRNYDEGKKITWRDGLVALWTLIKYRVVD